MANSSNPSSRENQVGVRLCDGSHKMLLERAYNVLFERAHKVLLQRAHKVLLQRRSVRKGKGGEGDVRLPEQLGNPIRVCRGTTDYAYLFLTWNCFARVGVASPHFFRNPRALRPIPWRRRIGTCSWTFLFSSSTSSTTCSPGPELGPSTIHNSDSWKKIVF